MNYRHIYHAGNFADVLKHAILARILTYLKQKDKPFRVIDTHAGIGLYDLSSTEAQRTGEALNGIGKMEESFSKEMETFLEPYRYVIQSVQKRFGSTFYPGSPTIIRELIRAQDRGIFVELHPEDYEILSQRFQTSINTKVMHLDGWTALNSLLPPKEKRGLVLIDPPFERTDELAHMIRSVLNAVKKWETGIFALWYPAKHGPALDQAWKTLKDSCQRPLLRMELCIQPVNDQKRLNGAGLFLINPPWLLAQEGKVLLEELTQRLSVSTKGGWNLQL